MRKNVHFGRSIRALLLGAFLATSPAVAWSAPSATPAYQDEQTAVRLGLERERDRHWVDAIELYEASLKQWPDNPQLKYGLRRARVQFSVDRRYSDRSYGDHLLRTSTADSMAYFDDVLTKTRRYYVDAIAPTAYVAHGTESLYIALINEKFLAHNAANASPDRVARLRKTLRDNYWNYPCPSDEAARRTVLEIAALAQRECGIPQNATVMEYVFGGCNSLDEYSSFMTPDRLDDLYNNIEGEFVGIGIEMKAESGKGLYLVNVLDDSPAEEGGARPGDYITRIDGVDCTKMSTEEAAQLLQGLPNSTLRLELYNERKDYRRPAQLVRRAVKVKSIPVVKMIDGPAGIGYFRMTGFQKNSADELDAALGTLQRQGARAIVWDLRGNPGGLLTAAVEVLDRFLDDGMIVSTRGRTNDQNQSYTATRGNETRLPLVVLVDGDSASASEIVAGCIHDHRRGVLVGRKTYGKWSVQSILPGRGNTGLRLTTAKFYSPNGNTYGKIGVEPDVAVPVSDTVTTAYRGRQDERPEDDADIAAALQVLRKQLASR